MIEFQKDLSIAPYTSYNIGGKAREVYFPENASELYDVFKALTENKVPYYMLGGGSNVLVGDGYWDGAVIITTKMDSFTVYEDRLDCGAGLSSTGVAKIAHENGKTGLEFLFKLPGSIGGAFAGNARFDSINVSDAIISVSAVHPLKGMKCFRTGEMQFDYKQTSILREGWIIGDLTLAWKDGNADAIKTKMDEIERFREDARHFEMPSCGCIFKNNHAKNIQAGRLIDSLGLKGTKVGGAEVAGFHANFIINNGNATACDVLDLIEIVEKTVRDKTGEELEREVKLLGSF